jgi:hypothetical protein
LINESDLLGWAFGALSIGLALLARQEETVIGAVQFVVLPATFLSSTLQQRLMPGWIAEVARFNPVNWPSRRVGVRSATARTGRWCCPEAAICSVSRSSVGGSRPGRSAPTNARSDPGHVIDAAC